MDTELNTLVAIARFHRLPAEAEQLSHEYGVPGEAFADTQILQASKALTLKAKILSPKFSQITNGMLPSIAKAKTLQEIAEYQRQLASLDEELAKATDLNAKQILYAPVSGQIQELAINTVGGVVSEAQQMLEILND